MSSNENFAIGTIVISATAFWFYFATVTQNGVLLEMEAATLGWLLFKIVVAVLIAEALLTGAIWSLPGASQPGKVDERENTNETKAMRNAYLLLNIMVATVVILVFVDHAFGWFGSYSPNQIEGLVFMLVAALSLAEIVHFGSIIIYGLR